MRLIYPAYVIHDEENEGYAVTIPDIDCLTEAATLSEAVTRSIEAASEILMKELESGNPIPKPTPIEYMKPVPGGFITMLMMYISAYAAKAGSIKKSLNIPRWLNSFAESRKIDYSELMRNVLTSLYEEQYSSETALTGGPRPLIGRRR
ncbi:MAG: type II toxin-antitoxin system HicB family antitoxin [Clostridiales bacterium]|jgi:predicted RNase H-like HicB family nuclease|nr:type II toxin-antitoxin system HicB family antitoxin [Clostridiales bacterium]